METLELRQKINDFKQMMFEAIDEVDSVMARIDQIEEQQQRHILTNAEAAKVIGISEGYFANLKMKLKKEGWFKLGVTQWEVQRLANWKQQHGSLQQAPPQRI